MIDKMRQAELLAQMRAMANETRPQAEPAPQAAGTEFAGMLERMVEQVNAAQHETKNLRQDFAMGDPNVDLAEVMVAMQKARVHFETLIQVRNRLVSAYEEIMRMPV